MLQRSDEFRVSKSAAAVSALFAIKPADWLGAFLRLAVRSTAGSAAAPSDQRPWFRLSEPRQVAPEQFTAQLAWRPHLDDQLFAGFRGEFHIVADGLTSVLSLTGETVGGQPRHNVTVMNRLLQLISTAIDSTHGLDG